MKYLELWALVGLLKADMIDYVTFFLEVTDIIIWACERNSTLLLILCQLVKSQNKHYAL